MRRSEPALAIEIREHDSAPVNVRSTGGVAFHMDAHHHRGALFYLANFAEGDVVAEASHQAGLQIQSAQIAGGETGNQEEKKASDHQRAHGDEDGREPERAVQLIRHGRARLERRRNCSGCAAANFERDKRGDRQREKNRQRDQKARLHGKNCGSEHAGEGQHREKSEIAVGSRGVKAHERGEEHQVNGCKQRCV